MSKFFKKISGDDAKVLLHLHLEMDDILDEGMVKEKPFHETLSKTLERAIEILNDYEKRCSCGRSESVSAIYIDHYQHRRIIPSEDSPGAKSYEELNEMLKLHGLIEQDVTDLSDKDSYRDDKLIVEKLEVSGEFVGALILNGSDLGEFHRQFISTIARKIDTDIYNQNRLKLEQLKNDGIEKINEILDSDLPLDKIYEEVIKVVVELVEAYGGYMVVPREGEYVISTRFVREDAPYRLQDEEILKVSEETLQKAMENQFIRVEEIDIPHGELLTILLKPGEKQIEGVLILHHEDFRDGHHQVANACSNLIDSSLYMNNLYVEIFENFLHALGVIIDTFDTYTSGHSHRVFVYSQAMGEVLGLSKLEMTKLRIASMLHDIGKVGVDPNIIRKKSKLTPEELKVVQSHTVYSDNILDGIFPFDLKDINYLASSHHEKENGSGYPRHLKSHKIPVLSKIIAIADIFDALTSDRPYHRGRTREQAYSILEEDAGKGKLSPELVDLFKKPEVWEKIRQEYQRLKIDSAVHWYRKDMLPNLKPLCEDLNKVKSSLEDIHKVRKKFKKGEEINLVTLEDSSLTPSEKDMLIQRELQKNHKGYLQLLRDMESAYRNRMHNLEAKRKLETRFRERFWDPNLVEEIVADLNQLNDREFDLYRENPELEKILPTEECSRNTSVMDMVECFFENSRKKKGLNREYLVPLRKVKMCLEFLLEEVKKESTAQLVTQ